MWRLLEKGEVPLIGDEVLQSGSLFMWVPVVNNIESSPVGSLVIRRKIEDTKELGTTPNMPSMPVCPNARLKWSVYDCTIKDSFALDLMDCNGEGTYSIPGNSGFGYSHQCNKVPGKPAHVG